ncbi:MAG TPA: class I SAM-dependent methyltransferase [Terriglobales bacterium]|jgi:trans-aconitate methyltransferase|nr:class I SAM-dependent methyltransferase [Terriglobales bacterium]
MSATTKWHPDSYAKNARFVSDLGVPLLELLAPQAGEVILDLGCGDGALTEKIAATGSIALGVDASIDQLHAARRRGLQVAVFDGQRLGLREKFDAVFSNAALHRMKQPENVIAGVAHCLKLGGRFVGEFGGRGNVRKIRRALHEGLRRRGIDPWTLDPWYYPSPVEYAQLLRRSGFSVAYIELIPRPTRLPGDILAWLEIFAQPFTQAVRASEREIFLQEIKSQLEPELRDENGSWIADYVRLRFQALKAAPV